MRKGPNTKLRNERRRAALASPGRRIDRELADRRQADAARARRFETFQRTYGHTGLRETTMGSFDQAMLRTTRVIDSSAGAVALVGPNPGTERWRRPRAYLGLFWLDPRKLVVT